ncbi:MAG TPA: AAA family ATPase [Polyangiaceae bacterium]|nr:AAA family ATPase [Polyangiaceae bacterium]
MIVRFQVINFRSLGSVELKLSGLTTLVGPNGAGKSSVVDGVRFLGDAVRHGLDAAVSERQGFEPLRRWSRGHARDVSLSVDVETASGRQTWALALTADAVAGFRVKQESAHSYPWQHNFERVSSRWAALQALLNSLADDDPQKMAVARQLSELGFSYKEERDKLASFELKDGAWVNVPPPLVLGSRSLPPPTWRPALPEVAKISPPFRPLVDELSRVAVYSLFPPTLRQPQNPDLSRPMRRHGENWAGTLRGLDREREGAELLAALSRIVGDIDDYRVTTAGGFLIPEFRHGVQNGRERWFGAAQESDGTLRIAALLTALLQQPPPSLIGIEEPELAVHPGALPTLADYLKEAATRTQVVITTHSPELLDLLPPESLRVVERIDGATTVKELAADQRTMIRERLFSTSELLSAEGLRGEPGEGPPAGGGDERGGEADDGQGLLRRRGPRRRRGGAEPRQPTVVRSGVATRRLGHEALAWPGA